MQGLTQRKFEAGTALGRYAEAVVSRMSYISVVGPRLVMLMMHRS